MNKRLALVYVLGSVVLLTAFKLPPVAAFMFGGAGTVDVNIGRIADSVISTVASGVQKVGIVGNAGAAFDAASGATAAPNSVQVGSVYNTTQPSLSSGQQAPLQADPYGNVRTNSNGVTYAQLAQAANNKISAGAATTITNAFGSATTPGNSILCIGFESTVTGSVAPVFTDAQANTYIVAASSAAAAPGYTVALASNIVGGTTDTITLTVVSGASSFSCYELKGTVQVGQIWDYAAGLQATSASLVFPQQSASIANDFVAVGVGMGAGTVNAAPSLAGVPSNLTTVDQQNTAPAGGAALAVFYTAHANVTNSPTFTQAISLSASETYSAVLVAVKPLSVSLVGNVQDPCQQGAGTSGNVNFTASGQLITGISGKQTYICSMNFISATAQSVSLVEGTGSTCGTGTAGMAGGATAATGWPLAANGGFVNGGGGFWVFKTSTPGNNVCLLLSGTGQVSGSYRQVQQ